MVILHISPPLYPSMGRYPISVCFPIITQQFTYCLPLLLAPLLPHPLMKLSFETRSQSKNQDPALALMVLQRRLFAQLFWELFCAWKDGYWLPQFKAVDLIFPIRPWQAALLKLEGTYGIHSTAFLRVNYEERSQAPS